MRYAETDRMGYVYYGNFAAYFEVGRVEALRTLGFPYRALEDEGVLLPVHDLKVTYHRPAFYDDVLTIHTTITEAPSVRIRFLYTVHDAAGVLLTEAATTLVFIDKATGRPRRCPRPLSEALAPYFKEAAAP